MLNVDPLKYMIKQRKVHVITKVDTSKKFHVQVSCKALNLRFVVLAAKFVALTFVEPCMYV